MINPIVKTIELPDGRTITLETGKLAKQADGSVMLRMGNTVLLATVCAAKDAVPGTDFMPLQVEYKEKYSAFGRFPGGFTKREGKASDYEILTCRLVARALRPLFPDNFNAEVDQVMVRGWLFDGNTANNRGAAAFPNYVADHEVGDHTINLGTLLGDNWTHGQKFIIMLEALNQADVRDQYFFTIDVDTVADVVVESANINTPHVQRTPSGSDGKDANGGNPQGDPAPKTGGPLPSFTSPISNLFGFLGSDLLVASNNASANGDNGSASGSVVALGESDEAEGTEVQGNLVDDTVVEEGCSSFLGVCWYWWLGGILLVVAIVGYVVKRSGGNYDDEIPLKRQP